MKKSFLSYDLARSLHCPSLSPPRTRVGYDADISASHIPRDAPDADVLALAQTLDAVLLTEDLDFSNILDYPPQNYAGIIVLRYMPIEEALIDATLKQTLADLYRDGLRRALVVVSAGRYRVRRMSQE